MYKNELKRGKTTRETDKPNLKVPFKYDYSVKYNKK